MTGNAHRIAEGALISGVYLVMFLLTLYTPLGIILPFLLPIPFFVYISRQGENGAFAVAVVCLLLTFLFAGLPALLTTLYAGATGIAMGMAYRRERPPFSIFMVGLVAALLCLALFIFLANLLFGMNLIEQMRVMMEESSAIASQLLEGMGIALEQGGWLARLPEVMIQLIPFLLIFSSAAISLLTFWVGGTLLRRLGMDVPQFPPFYTWHLPRFVLFMYLGTLVFLFIPEVSQVPILGAAVINLQPLFDLLFIVQGLSFVTFFARSKNWGRTLPVLAIIGLFLPPFSLLMTPFLSILGILDTGLPLRDRVGKR